MIQHDSLEYMKDIALKAGTILKEGFRKKDLSVSFKAKRDLVTEIDMASEKFLVESIHKKFPGHSIMAEEGNGLEGSEPFTWIIDPLDGTNNYVHGLPLFAVNLALYSEQDDEIIAGCTYNPISEEIYTACIGEGSYRGDEKLSVSQTSTMIDSLLATGYPYDKDDPLTNNTRETAAFMPKIRCLRRMGAASLDFCNVAAGHLEGYWERGLKPWDIAPGILIVREAGGTVTNFDGTEVSHHSPYICASNGLIHDEMISILLNP